MRRGACAAAVAAVVTLGFAGSAEARVIASESASGDYATAVAAGNASNPSRLQVSIRSTPRQHVTGNWSVVCSRGYGAGTKSGRISGSGSFTRTLRMPMRNPDDCSVSALGSLSGGGRIRVILRAT